MKCHTQLYKFEQCIIISYNEQSSTKTPKLSVPPQVVQTVAPQILQQHTTNRQFVHEDNNSKPQRHQRPRYI